MSKLFKLKKWLTLNDTAKRLSLNLNEEITVSDVLQIALDGHLKISLLLNEQYVCEIEYFYDVYLSKIDTANYLGSGKLPESIESLKVENKLRVHTELHPEHLEHLELKIEGTSVQTGSDYINNFFTVSGAYNLDLTKGEIRNSIHDWLISGEYNTGFEFNGITLLDNNGRQLALVEDDPDSEQVIVDGESHHCLMKGLRNIRDTPPLNQLVVLRQDIEKFEHSFTENDIEKPQIPIDLDNRILKTKTLTLLFESIQKGVSEFPSWKDEFNSDVIQMSDIDTWLYTSITSTKRDAEVVKKIITEIFNLKKSIK